MSHRTLSSRCPKCGELTRLEGLSQGKLRHLLDAHDAAAPEGRRQADLREKAHVRRLWEIRLARLSARIRAVPRNWPRLNPTTAEL